MARATWPDELKPLRHSQAPQEQAARWVCSAEPGQVQSSTDRRGSRNFNFVLPRICQPPWWRPGDQQKALALPQPPAAGSFPGEEAFTGGVCFHLLARRPSRGGTRPAPGLSCVLHRCSTPRCPWGRSPRAPTWDAALPALFMLRIKIAARGEWQRR